MTYDSLNSTVLQYLERQDQSVVNAIPTFITLCEFEIAQEIKTLGQLSVVTSNMSASNPVLQKPARWRKTVSMTILGATEATPVLLRKFEYLKTYWPTVTLTGLPEFYADIDYDHWYCTTSEFNPYLPRTKPIGLRKMRQMQCCMEPFCKPCRF